MGARDGQDDSIKGEQATSSLSLPPADPHPSEQMRQVQTRDKTNSSTPYSQCSTASTTRAPPWSSAPW